MRKENWQKFMKSGNIKDYLAYKRASKMDVEIASDNLKIGEKNDCKRGNNSKKY